jgi:hypothetical protein
MLQFGDEPPRSLHQTVKAPNNGRGRSDSSLWDDNALELATGNLGPSNHLVPEILPVSWRKRLDTNFQV